MSAPLDQTAGRLHDLLLAFQKVQRFAALAFGIPVENVSAQVGHTEESILFVICAEPDKSVKELAELLSLERSWVSRVVAGLEAKQLVRALAHPTDRRSKQVRATAKGKDVLREAEHVWQQVMARCLEPISAAEKATLTALLKKLADGFGARDYERHAAGDPVAYQLGRLSAAVGVWGRGIFGSDFSITQVQMLYALRELGDGPVQVSAVKRLVPQDMSTVSRVLQEFERRGLVKKAKDKFDRRSLAVAFTPAGKSALAQYRRRAADACAAALGGFSKAELEELPALLERLVSAAGARAGSAAEPAAFKAVAETDAARAVALLSDGAAGAGPGEIRRVGLYRGGELAAVVEIERSKVTGAVRRLQFGGEELPHHKCLALIRSGLAEEQA